MVGSRILAMSIVKKDDLWVASAMVAEQTEGGHIKVLVSSELSAERRQYDCWLCASSGLTEAAVVKYADLLP